MGYRTLKDTKTQRMTPEEAEVRWALIRYTDDPSEASGNDFVPTRVLYSLYLDYRKDNPSEVGELPLGHFGIALRRVFVSAKKASRTYKGKKCCGYRLKGPLSIWTPDFAGRPKHDPKAPATAAAIQGRP